MYLMTLSKSLFSFINFDIRMNLLTYNDIFTMYQSKILELHHYNKEYLWSRFYPSLDNVEDWVTYLKLYRLYTHEIFIKK